MFNKSNQAPAEPVLSAQPLDNQAPVAGSGSPSDVFIMPERFREQPVRNPSNKPLIIAVVILLAVIVVTAAFFLYDASVSKNAKIAQQQQTTTAPVIENINAGTEAEEEEVISSTTEELLASSTEESATSTLATATPDLSAPILSRDSDSDGLTDIEEALIGTDMMRPDSDIDGYKDSDEVINRYNPLADGLKGKGGLLDADFIATSTSNFTTNNFSLVYPKKWKVSYIPENQQALITAETGEIIRITARNNDQGMSAVNWYLSSRPQTSVSELKLLNDKAYSGFFTPDGLSAYITDNAFKKLYVFEYLTNPQTELRYPALFTMIVKNLTAVSPPAETAASSTAASE